jgi:hypothetical protein
MSVSRCLRRRAAVALLATCPLVAIAASSVAAQTSGSTPPATVALRGEGADDPLGEMTAWQNDLFGTAKDGLIDLHYLANGGYAARQDFLAGSIDYALSGVPFTPAELAKLPNGASDLIDAPVQVAAMGMLLQPPATSKGSFGVLRQVCDPNNPPTVIPPGVDPNDCTMWVPFTGPVLIPHPNLAAMLFNYSGGATPPLHEWDSAGVTAALAALQPPDVPINMTQGSDFGPPAFLPQGVVGGTPIPFLRSEPSETNYYLQQYVTTAAPAVWTGLQPAGHPFGAVTERLPILAVGTRPGVDAQVQAVEVPQGIGGGFVAPVPPYAIARARSEAPSLKFQWVKVQNAKGEWLEPTTASINAAVNAGGDSPLYALSNPVPGAYPLVWVTHLYAPAHGLSAAKTETLATVIRYLATAGQGATSSAGDGQLPPAVAAKALAAANQLVLSNCTGTGFVLTGSASPGIYAPPSLAQQHLGQMLHCAQAPPAPASTATTSTRVAATGSGGGVSTSQQVLATSSSALPVTGPGPAATAAAGPPATSKDPGKGVPILAKLPLPFPWSGGGGWDPLSGLVIGAVLFLLARKPWRALVSALKA